MSTLNCIKSPLRYPGGKSKAINFLVDYLPEKFSEYREPFVGGGSFFIYLKQKNPHLKIWINDLNTELFLFWKVAQTDLKNLVKEVINLKKNCDNGKQLFQELITVDVNKLSDLERGIRFFILNRITFSGTVESGGFSNAAFQKRFTYSSIERLEKMEYILTNVTITNLDYQEVIKYMGNDVFIFLDPPYFNATKSKLYGKKGNLHLKFDHERFANIIDKCNQKWLITYDDSMLIRNNFKQFYIQEWELQYGMNNYKQKSATKGKELLISNYLSSHNDPQHKQLNLNLY